MPIFGGIGERAGRVSCNGPTATRWSSTHLALKRAGIDRNTPDPPRRLPAPAAIRPRAAATNSRCAAALRRAVQVETHSIGDRGHPITLDVYERGVGRRSRQPA